MLTNTSLLKEASSGSPSPSPPSQRDMLQAQVQVLSYVGVGTLAFVLSAIFFKCMSYLCNRMINRQGQAAAAAAGGSAYRQVVVERSASSRVEVVVGEASCSSISDSSSSSSSGGHNHSDNYGKEEGLSDCRICLCEIENGDVCWDLTACNHRFHADCIRKWMKKSRNCPLCRTAICG